MSTKPRRNANRGIMVVLLAAFIMAAGAMPAMAGASAQAAVWQKAGMEKHRHHRPPLGIWQDPEMIQKLELTEAQISKLREAYFTSRENKLGLKAQLDRLDLQMERAFSADAVDQKAVRELAEKIAEARGNRFIQKIESRLMIGKILNADQMKKLKQQLWQKKKCGPKADRKDRGKNRAI